MQKIFLYFLIFTTGISSIICAEEQTRERIESSAQDKLESGFEKTAVGAVEVGFGVFKATRGDVVGAAAATIDGLERIKRGVKDFQESKELFDRARDMESPSDEPPDIIRGCPDHEY